MSYAEIVDVAYGLSLERRNGEPPMSPARSKSWEDPSLVDLIQEEVMDTKANSQHH